MRGAQAALCLLAVAAWLCPAVCRAGEKNIVVYHTTDIHGSLVPHRVEGSSFAMETGGLAAYAACVKKEKQPVLLLDSGDWFQGTPEGNYQKGLPTVLLLNRLGLAAAAPGNHEFDYGEDSLRAIISSASF
ncbi:MAG TPA: metallophosphoesterase, partial [Elusimicrobiales bacterium]|nr:metallophosphoesterase [Elusimicrobiales bacterium]